MAKRSRTTHTGSPRLDDVARLAGVSTATVSRALNRPQLVSGRLRRGIEEAIETLGYVPHGAARALAGRRSHTMGAIIPTIDNAIFARGIQALQNTLFAHGFTLLLASSDYDLDRELRAARRLLERGVDGVLLVGNVHRLALYALLRDRRVPYVQTWVHGDDVEHACIGFDNRGAIIRVVDHLVDLGHRRIAMIAGVTRDNDRARERVEGAQQALAAHGLHLPRGWLLERPYEVAAGRTAMAELMAAARPPTAVVCGNDVLALGAIFECGSRGIEVPGQVSITGFDDLDIAAQVNPALTTMHVPSEEMGRGAAQYLLACLDNRQPPARTRLEVKLVERATTGPPPRGCR